MLVCLYLLFVAGFKDHLLMPQVEIAHFSRDAPDPDPYPAGYPVNLMDPAGSNVSGSSSDPDTA